MIFHHILQILLLSYAEETTEWSPMHPGRSWENSFTECIPHLWPWYTSLQVPHSFHYRILFPSLFPRFSQVFWGDFWYLLNYLSICSISEVGFKGRNHNFVLDILSETLCSYYNNCHEFVLISIHYWTCLLKITFCSWNLVYSRLSLTFWTKIKNTGVLKAS